MMTVLVSFLSEIKGEGACAQGESFVVFVILSTFLTSKPPKNPREKE